MTYLYVLLFIIMILLQVSGLNYGLIKDYFPLIISNILVLLFFLFFQSNKQKADTAYKSHIAELEARSLRVQMNPHFIYNALKIFKGISPKDFRRYWP